MAITKKSLRLPIERSILELRGERIILDADLATIYGVSNKRLLQQFSRNRKKFPSDFAFTLTMAEWDSLRLQNEATKRRGGRRRPPVAFTEHGAIMAATMLASEQAVAMSVFVVRAFVKFRDALAGSRALESKLDRVRRELVRRLDGHDEQIIEILDELHALIPLKSQTRRIGFQLPAATGDGNRGLKPKR